MGRMRRLAALGRGVPLLLLTNLARAQDGDGAGDSTSDAGPDAEECGQAYERAQESRADAKLQAAMEALLVCAQPNCPSFVQTDCTQWMGEVKRELPSVVVAAVGVDGEETVDVQVLVDGQEQTNALDGRAFPIDPGVHQFEFRHADRPVIKRRIVVRQGQQNRTIKVSFEIKKPTPITPAVATVDETPSFFQEHRDDIRLGSYIGAGVGAAGIGVGVTFWVLGKQEESDFLRDCDYNAMLRACGIPQTATRIAEVNQSVADTLLIGNISAIAGGAVLALSITAYLLTEPWADEGAASEGDVARKSNDAVLRDVSFGAAPTPGGGFVGVAGRF